MKHNILVKFIKDIDYQKLLPDIKDLFSGLLIIKGIHKVDFHRNCIDRANRYDLLIQIDMDEEALPIYDDSLIHKTWKQQYVNFIEKKAIFDYKD